MEARTNIQVENKQYNATTCIQLHMFHCDKCLSHNYTGKILLSLTVLSSSSPLDVQGRSINKHQKFILGHLQPRTISNLVGWWLHQYTSFEPLTETVRIWSWWSIILTFSCFGCWICWRWTCWWGACIEIPFSIWFLHFALNLDLTIKVFTVFAKLPIAIAISRITRRMLKYPTSAWLSVQD